MKGNKVPKQPPTLPETPPPKEVTDFLEALEEGLAAVEQLRELWASLVALAQYDIERPKELYSRLLAMTNLLYGRCQTCAENDAAVREFVASLRSEPMVG